MADIHIEQITQELTWRLRRNALYPGAHIADMAMPQDDAGTHYGAFFENSLVAVASVFIDETSYEIRNLAIETVSTQQNPGIALLTYIAERAAENGITKLWSKVQPMFVEVYQESGFSFNGENLIKMVLTKS